MATPAHRARAVDPRASSPRASNPEASDADLLAAVRAGTTSAYGQLYARHQDAARRLAGALARDPSDADDLVAEAFAKVLSVLQRGGGPEVGFRPYLLTALRHVCYDRTRTQQRVQLTEDMSRYEQPAYSDPTEEALDRSYAARAFAKLPERWRMVLWHTEVEGERPARIAPLLGLSPNAVAALAYRARERLRQMYLQEHLNTTREPACHWTADRLGAHVRGGLPRGERSRVDSHLAACQDCERLWTELSALNAELRGVLGPLVLGAAAGPYLAASAPGILAGWLAAITAWLATGWAMLSDLAARAWVTVTGWVRRLVQRYGPGNVAAGTGVAAATLVGVAMFGFAMALDPTGSPPPPPEAGDPVAPVPAPAPLPPLPDDGPTAAPTGEPTTAPPGGGQQVPAGQAVAPEPTPTASPTPTATPSPAPPPPIEVVPDLGGTALVAAGSGPLPLDVTLPDGAGTPEAAAADAAVSVQVSWPAGMALVPDGDPGDGWECTATDDGTRCQRPVWPAGQTRTARLQVSVDESVTGFAPVEVTVATGGQRDESGFQIPVAPPGMAVGFASSGRNALALAGNTWLSCPEPPDCGPDNNEVDLTAYLPGAGGPTPPDGLAEGMAASGAHLPVPDPTTVAWAGLHWATVADHGPRRISVAAPDGDWRQVTAETVAHGSARPLWQAYAEVTELVRSAPAGDWWLAARADELPHGKRSSAGWSLTVVYADGTIAGGDVAIFAGPRALDTTTGAVSFSAGGPGQRAEVGLVLWEGDRTRTGDTLRLGDSPLGKPDNVASSRAAGALECGDAPVADCDWHTFGVDVARYAGDGGPLRLRTGQADLAELGVLALTLQSAR